MIERNQWAVQRDALTTLFCLLADYFLTKMQLCSTIRPWSVSSNSVQTCQECCAHNFTKHLFIHVYMLQSSSHGGVSILACQSKYGSSSWTLDLALNTVTTVLLYFKQFNKTLPDLSDTMRNTQQSVRNISNKSQPRKYVHIIQRYKCSQLLWCGFKGRTLCFPNTPDVSPAKRPASEMIKYSRNQPIKMTGRTIFWPKL